MPRYDFQCKKCKHEYEDFATMAERTKNCPKIKCPQCGSKSKLNLITSVTIGGPTSSKLDNFGYRAGHNMAKAQDERRLAETFSHMGANPYGGVGDSAAITDIESMGEGLHDPEFRPGLL